MIFSLNRFSFKTEEQIKAPRKVYLIDNGFILAKSFQFSQNFERLMENLVFIEILRRGYSINREVFYYKTSNETEVDFVLRKGIGFEKLIRVCYEIENIEIRERKLKGLAKAAGELNCNTLMVITWDYEAEEEFKGKKVSFIPLWKWLLS